MPRRTEGFSLIEAAVAIAIMAILAGAAVPMILKAVNQQREQVTRDGLKVAYEAMFGARDRRIPNMVADFGYQPAAGDLRDLTARPVGAAVWQAGPNFYYGWNGPYWNGSLRTVGAVNVPADGWGNALALQNTGGLWQVVSGGADGNLATPGDNLAYPSQPVALATASLNLTLQNQRGVAINGNVRITDRNGGVLRTTLATDVTYDWALPIAGSAQAHGAPIPVNAGPVTITINLLAPAPAATLVEVVDLVPGQSFSHTYSLY
jgi:prepilin-type N-terminal cleavage/methylation domain-containing protein